MIDAACNYLNPYATASLAAAHTAMSTSPPMAITHPTQQCLQQSNGVVSGGSGASNFVAAAAAASTAAAAAAVALYNKTPSNSAIAAAMKMEIQYPPQPSSTGSAASPNSSIQSAPSSASMSPNIFPSPAQSFASISSSPPASATSSVSPFSGSSAALGHHHSAHHHHHHHHHGHTSSSASGAGGSAADLGAAAAASATYPWNTYSTLPGRAQFPYTQYASEYYGNVGMSASAAGAWFSQDRLYQPWPSQPYAGFNIDEIAFQTQLQRRSVRCTCPNCSNEMSGLPPIVGPDERGRKQHICHIPGCERLYGKASHLKTHLRWHTGERPFLCVHCGKRFSRSDELQRHTRTHTNYRPYACPICSKKFSRSDHLSKHKKTHFKDKKSKKALAAEAKDQVANATTAATTSVKEEKPIQATLEKAQKSTPIKSEGSSSSAVASPPTQTSSINGKANTSSTQRTTQQSTAFSQSQLQLKSEQSDIPSGYNPYAHLYHQSPSIFHHRPYDIRHSSASTNLALSNTAAAVDLWNSSSSHAQPQAQFSRTAIDQPINSSGGISNNTTTSPNANMELSATAIATSSGSQHYAALALQSESQLAAEYGLTMSTPSGISASNHQIMQQPPTSNTAYSGFIGHMKSEYPSYPDFSSSNGYTSTGAFHHHAHSPWASAASYSHATT